MASVSKREEIYTQQAMLLYRGVPSAVAINVLNAALLGFMLRDAADSFFVGLWASAFVVLIVVRMALFVAFQKRTANPHTVTKWVMAMVAVLALLGLVWGSAAWVFMPAGQIEFHLLTAMVMFVLATGGMSGLYPVFAAYVAFVTPMMTLLLVRFYTIGTDLHFAMAASGGTLLLFLIYFAKRHRDELIKSLMLRIENRDLLSRLKTENISVRRDNIEKARMENLLRQKSAVLDAVSQVQSLFIADHQPATIFDETLDTILQLTRSEYGFIGEVLTDENGVRYLKTFSVTDVSWDAQTKAFYEQHAPLGMEFRKHQSLFGEVLRTGEPVIANDPKNDPRACGLPQGHPALDAFMGVPLYLGERMVGMIGLANRPGGYGEDLLIALDPVVSAAAGMVEAVQNRRERDQAQRDAANAMERLTTAIEALNDGFVIYDSEDRLALCNSKYKEIYHDVADLLIPGTTFEEIIRTGIARNQFTRNDESDEEWIQNRLAIHRGKESLLEQKLSDGTWLRIEERETPDGGHVGFRVDITELKQAQENVVKASQAKTEFLASMSHELRTPMNAVLGFAQLLQMHPQVPLHPKQRDAVEQILKAGNHLLELINEILDLTRIESGRVNLTLENVDPHDVIEECLAYIAPLAKKRGVRVKAGEAPKHRLSIVADRTRFKQVLLNLLSNAVKYNVDNGEVELSAQAVSPERMRFSVRDTGPGIAPELQQEIFEPFSRLGAETSDIEGTGIGLTISRKLASLMGGRLDFESVVGEGSTFWVDLPASEHAVLEQEQAPEGSNVLPMMPDGVHKVLYVEDNPDNLNLMEHVMRMVPGVEMISAHTGELGVEMAEIHHPAVILMDINLPGISGIEALKRLRATPTTRDIPILAVSANVMPADIRHAMEAGFDAYITKPVNLREVIEYVKTAIEGKLGPRAKR